MVIIAVFYHLVFLIKSTHILYTAAICWRRRSFVIKHAQKIIDDLAKGVIQHWIYGIPYTTAILCTPGPSTGTCYMTISIDLNYNFSHIKQELSMKDSKET